MRLFLRNPVLGATLFVVLLVMSAAGCGPKWVNPDLPPAEAKSKLEADTQRCHDQVDATLPPLEGNDRDTPDTGPFAASAGDWQFDEQRMMMFDECMQAHGWQKN